MQPTTSINDSPLIFPYRVLNQAGFGNPFISQREFICLGISQMSFTFYVFARVQGSISIKAARKANILDYKHIIAGTWKSHFKHFEFKCLEPRAT